MISDYREDIFCYQNTSTGQEFLEARIFDMTESFLLENPLKRCKNALKTVQGRCSCLVFKKYCRDI